MEVSRLDKQLLHKTQFVQIEINKRYKVGEAFTKKPTYSKTVIIESS